MSETEAAAAPEATEVDSSSEGAQTADASESQASGGRKASSETDVASILSEDSEGEDEAPEGKAKAEKPAEKRKYRVKVDEAEEEVEEDELLRGYQKAKASDKRFQEAARKEKAISDLLQTLQKDPAQVLKQMGMDFDKLAEERLLAKLEDSMLSPEEKELRDLRSLRERVQAEEKARREQAEAAEREERYTRALEEIDQDIAAALSEAGLKPTPRTLARMAEYMLAAIDSEQGRLPAKDAFARVKEDYAQDVREWLSALPAEQVVQALPKEVLAAIRSHDVAQAKAKLSAPPSREQAAPPRKAKDEWKSLDELLG